MFARKGISVGMIEYIDTHAHLYLPEFDADRGEVIKRALKQGIKKILLPNIDSFSIRRMNDMAVEFPGMCYTMMGLHPTSVKESFREELDTVTNELKRGSYKGIGEVGIDLYWDKTFLKQQLEAFAIQLELSLQYKLPIVIHARESFAEILDIIRAYRNRGLKGIFHAFTGDVDIANEITAMGFKLGIGGILTYKKSELPAVIRETALEHLVLETDSPYLAPVPYRGKRNESSYIPDIAQAMQAVKNVSLEEVAETTTRNVMEIFTLPDDDQTA
jgi:TatD DNase family protein